MNLKVKNYLITYFTVLFIFGFFFLYQKHSVGNDSTISEWLINYSGGFTKRGLIGQLCVYLSIFFNLELRDSIFILQTLILFIYFFILFNFIKNIKFNKLLLLATLTPIFVLYPIAEIEVLARKEIFIFCIFIFYLTDIAQKYTAIYKLTFLPIAILIWEPVVFFIPFWFAVDIINKKIYNFNSVFIKTFFLYIPAILISLYIALNPMSDESHLEMVSFLKNDFNESCYMSCGLLKTKSSIVQQFQGNFGRYSIEVFLRYFLIITIGFGPLFLIYKNSRLNNKDLIFFKFYHNLLLPFLIISSPVILLFAMGFDWGRWVNISYTFSIIFYFFLNKKKLITTDKVLFMNIHKFFNYRYLYILFFIFYCFGWNPKTVITGDVASFPGYRIPYKTFKIINNKYIDRSNSY